MAITTAAYLAVFFTYVASRPLDTSEAASTSHISRLNNTGIEDATTITTSGNTTSIIPSTTLVTSRTSRSSPLTSDLELTEAPPKTTVYPAIINVPAETFIPPIQSTIHQLEVTPLQTIPNPGIPSVSPTSEQTEGSPGSSVSPTPVTQAGLPAFTVALITLLIFFIIIVLTTLFVWRRRRFNKNEKENRSGLMQKISSGKLFLPTSPTPFPKVDMRSPINRRSSFVSFTQTNRYSSRTFENPFEDPRESTSFSIDQDPFADPSPSQRRPMIRIQPPSFTSSCPSSPQSVYSDYLDSDMFSVPTCT